MKIFRILLIGFVLTVLAESTVFAQSPVVIVNRDVPVASLTSSAVQKIFLGKKTQWKNGTKIIPVVLMGGAVHRAFLKEMVKKTPPQFSTFWKRKVFTGKSQALKAFRAEKELARYVAQTPGAIGYINEKTSCPGTKKVLVAP